MIPLINHYSQWGRSEVVIIYPDGCNLAIVCHCGVINFVTPKLLVKGWQHFTRSGGLWTIFLGSKAFLDIPDVNVRKNSHVCWLVGGCEVERIEGSKRKATQSYNDILVGGIPTPLKNMSSSVGIMRFPIYGKIKNVPNHQPVWPPGPADSIPFLHCFTHLKKRPRLAFTVPLPEVPLEWDWRPRQLLLSPAQLARYKPISYHSN